MRIVCLNAGSSSLKVALFDVGDGSERRVASAEAAFGDGASTDEALAGALAKLGQGAPPDAVGHRLVHGGPSRFSPALVTPDVRAELAAAVPFAPLHLPSELALLDAATKAFPGIPEVVCFDTSFHESLPDVARRLPIAGWADARGVRRYGFHGLSYAFVVSSVGKDTLGPSVIAHLGSGASMAAIRDGRSIDTTMGMSPTGGIMMGTRTGDVDPGALIHLLDVGDRGRPWSARDLERFVNHEGGLRGVSGTTSDMRKLLAARDRDPAARLAVALFVYGARKAIGALAVALGDLRSLVFTGGIGEGSDVVRSEICAGLGLVGVRLDPAANAARAEVISLERAPCTVRVVHTDEEVMIARHVRAALHANAGGGGAG